MGVVRWKLLVWVCVVAGLAGYGVSFARSTPHSNARALQDSSVRLAQSPIRWIAVRQLAHGRLPGRQTFTITGERYRFQGRVYLTLAISIDRPGEPPGGGGGGSFNPSQTPGMLAYTTIVECTPHPYAVVFGLLRAPSNIVVARVGNSRTVLRHVSIPAVLDAHGVLAYARLAGPPSEVTVQRPDGTRLLDNKFQGGSCSPGTVIVLQSQTHPPAR
jgi:hypothetical protein